MRRITPIFILLICLVFQQVNPAVAGLFSNDTLVSIDGQDYSIEDFKRWWKFWREGEQKLPETPDQYIDWLLLSREARNIQMDETPGFKRQSRIFIQSRALLMLKNEEVNSKINITEDDIMARYEKEYLPRWLVQRLEFTSEKHAMSAWRKLSQGTLTMEELLKTMEEWNDLTGGELTSEEHDKLAADHEGPIDAIENWLRPNQIEAGWSDIFKKLEVGEVVDPSEHNKGRILYVLKEQKGADEEDLAGLREDIEKKLWKEQEDILTQALLDKLIDKYQVTIDEERLAALDISASRDTLTDDPIITSTKQNISEKQFMAVIEKLIQNRPTAAHALADEEEAKTLKTEAANNIIYQAVTNWESLDRHYEEKEPFMWEYDFNYRHRLVLALEKQFFAPNAEVSEEEIRQHYEENTNLYTQPTLVKLYIVDETQAPIEQIWAEVSTGKDFKQALREHFEQPPQPQEAPANHLDPEVKDIVSKLVEEETSQIFTAQGIKVLVHLVERTPEMPFPLERVRNSIRSRLWREKINKARSTYLDKIKSNSKIEVNQRNWKKIQKELGGV